MYMPYIFFEEIKKTENQKDVQPFLCQTGELEKVEKINCVGEKRFQILEELNCLLCLFGIATGQWGSKIETGELNDIGLGKNEE